MEHKSRRIPIVLIAIISIPLLIIFCIALNLLIPNRIQLTPFTDQAKVFDKWTIIKENFGDSSDYRYLIQDEAGNSTPLVSTFLPSTRFEYTTLSINSKNYLLTRAESEGSWDMFFWGVYRFDDEMEIIETGIPGCFMPEIKGDNLVFYLPVFNNDCTLAILKKPDTIINLNSNPND